MADLVTLVARESARLPAAAWSAPVEVAVSGGADSTALLHALARWAGTASIRLHAVHVDHGLRDAESRAKDVAAVTALCQSIGVQLSVERLQVMGAGRARSENAARDARYRALAEVATRIEARVIAVGHHADDQVETVLLHLLRGSGASGLRGMRPLRKTAYTANAEDPSPVLWRPLLGARRAEIVAYCREHDLAYSEDLSNADERFSRNRVRRLVVPALERAADNAIASIGRFAGTIAAEDDLLDQLTQTASSRIVFHHGAYVAVHRGALRSEHLALRRRVLRHAWLQATGTQVDLYARHIESALHHLVGAATGARLDLPRGQLLVVDHEFGYIGPRTSLLDRLRVDFGAPLVAPKWSFLLGSDVGLSLELPGGRYRVSWATRTSGGERQAGVVVALPGGHADTLVFRTRRPGDVVTLPGGHHRPLQDWLVDHHVPAYVRDQLVILARDRTVQWIAGVADFPPFRADREDAAGLTFTLWYDDWPVAPVRGSRSAGGVTAME